MKMGNTKTTKNIEKITSIDELDSTYLKFLEKMIITNNIREASKHAKLSYSQARRIVKKMDTNEHIQNYINKKRKRQKIKIQEKIKIHEFEMYDFLNKMRKGEIKEEKEVVIEGEVFNIKYSNKLKAAKILLDATKMLDEEFSHRKKIDYEKLRLDKLRLARELKNDKLKREDSYY